MKYELTTDETRLALRRYLEDRGVPVDPEDEIAGQGDTGFLTLTAGPCPDRERDGEDGSEDTGDNLRKIPVTSVHDGRLPDEFQGRSRRWPRGFAYDPTPFRRFLQRNPELDVRDVAEAVGASRSAVRGWAEGSRTERPGVYWLVRLAEELNVDPRMFIESSEPGERGEDDD